MFVETQINHIEWPHENRIPNKWKKVAFQINEIERIEEHQENEYICVIHMKRNFITTSEKYGSRQTQKSFICNESYDSLMERISKIWRAT